ncbi:hypothetical protein BM523_17865 [Alteromonas mediterranea]|uniref:hypothetical protein n=1 Tax=Alteromonas mediterranea TaxID=314275 RepID=UPI0009031504|nr:hypothetical protein [Alteromonas mediterranea]APD95710.1 hypothetical protein BM523_17865 [Alteromonas mediterranea]APD99344.1 hypothetical protein BM525_17890 [Alteromonas mediterranea]
MIQMFSFCMNKSFFASFLLFIGCFLCLLPLDSFAIGTAYSYTVETVRVDKSGRGYVKFKEPLSGEPATCINGNHDNHLAFDTNTAGGKSILSIVLSAHATGSKIHASGTGTCDVYGVVESWSTGWILPRP